MSKQPRSHNLAANEISPGVFVADNLPQFDMQNAISKRAYGNRSYFSDESSRSHVNTYWYIDGTGSEQGVRDLLRYSLFGHSIESGNIELEMAKEYTDFLRKIITNNAAALIALDTLEEAIGNKNTQDRVKRIEKVGSYIAKHVNNYHLLLDDEYTDSHNYEMTGKFAHLRGIGMIETGEEVPVVTGTDRTIATLPSFKDTTLYFG